MEAPPCCLLDFLPFLMRLRQIGLSGESDERASFSLDRRGKGVLSYFRVITVYDLMGSHNVDYQLTERERVIFRAVLLEYIATAYPVGSKAISENYRLGISTATIRNTLMRLESLGFLDQPHTSAGRIPTDKGYRFYIDQLMKPKQLEWEEKWRIWAELESVEGDVERVLEHASRALGMVSKQLGVTIAPIFDEAILERLELIAASSDRMLLILSISSGLIKTVLIEVDFQLTDRKIRQTTQVLNERLGGLSLREIRESIRERVNEDSGEPTLIGLILNQAHRLFDLSDEEHFHYGGAKNIVAQPEFSDPRKLLELFEFIEDGTQLTKILFSRVARGQTQVTVGSENACGQMRDCSLVTSAYRTGDVSGIVGVLGPTRMKYRELIPLVQYTAEMLGEILSRS